MTTFTYPKELNERPVYVRMPVQTNSGWVAADITEKGYKIDIESPIFDSSEYETCLHECREHNAIFWENWQVEQVVKTSFEAQNQMAGGQKELLAFAMRVGALIAIVAVLMIISYII